MSLIDVIAEYERILRERYVQYNELKIRRELSKAGEILWSIIMIMLTMVSLVLTGKPLARHSEAKRFVKKDLSSIYYSLYGMDPARLVALFEAAERLHANFYHEFLDEEELLEHLGAGEELATVLRDILDTIMRF